MTTNPGSRRPRFMAEVRAEAARLYADHDALARTLRERDPIRRAEVDEALARQEAAYAAEDQAWQTLDDADQALRDNPADPGLAAAVAAAAATYRAARDEAHAAGEHVDPSRHGHAGPDTPEITARYAERNALIWTALALAHEAGIPAGVGYDPTDSHPVVVYLELPDVGQVSWHLPGHLTGGDGHSTTAKYERVEAFTARLTAVAG